MESNNSSQSITRRSSSSKTENEPTIGIDLGTTNSCVSIIRNGNVEIIEDKNTGKRLIASIVCYKNNECLIGNIAKKNFYNYPESTMYNSKRLIGHKFKNEYVQEDIKNWPIKVIEDKKTGKPQYVIKIGNEEKKFFPEDVSSMILKYIKNNAEIHENKEIKKVVIGVPAHFNNLQRDATIKAAKEAGFEVIKLLNEPTAAAIAYGDIIKSYKERNVLIFDLGGGTFDVSIVKIKGKEYNVLVSLGEEHLGGEDFNQRLMKYVIREIKNNKRFKDIDFNNKEDKKIIKLFRKLRKETENVKIRLSAEDNVTFFIEDLNGTDDYKLEITRRKYEELCIDLWNKCIDKVEETMEKEKLKIYDIDEIILVGGSTRTPKIKKLIEEYFKKKPLQNINAEEVVAYGAVVHSIKEKNIIIKDIIIKGIGICIKEGKMHIIIPSGTPITLRKENKLQYKQTFILTKEKAKYETIKIYQGNEKFVKDNEYLGEFKVDIKDNEKNVKIIISMIIDYNSILKITAYVNERKDNVMEIKMNFNY